MAEYLFLVGMSGAGRSTAAAAFDDRGWFVIDNLPPALLGRIGELANQPGSEYERLCLVSGRGGYEGLGDLRPAIESLKSSGARVRVLFLEAPDEILVRRYEDSRRRHPVETEGGVLEAIRHERELLKPLREEADVVIDTGDLSVHELRERLIDLLDSGSESGMDTSIVSFGFKHGLPLDADLVFDCRFLPNPHWVPNLRPLTGLDEPVREYVLASDDAQALLARLGDLLELVLPAYVREGKSYLSIAVGCTGGQHRSVVIAEEIGSILRRLGFHPTVHHRDLGR
ncbi:MAG TPA: RNase adapter RapZ [Acidimicrobiales bacterium]|nr:RNase adapter RapZ [Acidimicrobiales bacterium]